MYKSLEEYLGISGEIVNKDQMVDFAKFIQSLIYSNLKSKTSPSFEFIYNPEITEVSYLLIYGIGDKSFENSTLLRFRNFYNEEKSQETKKILKSDNYSVQTILALTNESDKITKYCPEEYKNNHPNLEKIVEELRESYLEYGNFKTPVVLNFKKEDYRNKDITINALDTNNAKNLIKNFENIFKKYDVIERLNKFDGKIDINFLDSTPDIFGAISYQVPTMQKGYTIFQVGFNENTIIASKLLD